jgi:ribosomal protein L11 methylase PrmA
VTGCDREEASLETAAANAEVNGVELALERLDVREAVPPVAPTVVANLTGNLLRDCASHIDDGVRPPEKLVCSGMLESEIDEVAGAFETIGLREAHRVTEHEWGALLLRHEPAH